MFGYLAVEGILHTRSLKKNCLRLCTWAVAVAVGNELLEYILIGLASDITPANQVYLTIRTNITITLAAGVLCIALTIWAKEKKGIVKYSYFLLLSYTMGREVQIASSINISSMFSIHCIFG